MDSTLIKLYFFCGISCLLLHSSFCRLNFENDKSLQNILNDLIEKSYKETGHQTRRQLDFGSENSQESSNNWSEEDEVIPSHNVTSEIAPESWTGRWFPEKATEPPHQIATVIPPKTWTGRWFPDIVTEPPHHITSEIPPQSWTGKWFPTTKRPNASFSANFGRNEVSSENSMWRMINSSCDDGKTNLTVDWNGSPINYTCLHPHQYFLPDYDIPSIIIKSLIPKAYKAKHECMKNEIHYTSDIPTFGTHRPAWPKYGEYQFVPKQRWIHSLEHGAIVMLYHPCAHPQLVNELRELVTRCLFRHIITPYTLLPHDRPLAVLSWGWALLMSAPEESAVKTFIMDHAKKGPEALSQDGQFSEGLLRPAAIISDADDSRLCPRQALF